MVQCILLSPKPCCYFLVKQADVMFMPWFQPEADSLLLNLFFSVPDVSEINICQ